MTRIALIAGTYQPHHCGVAHYTERLRETLAKQGIEFVVLTTHAAASFTNDSSVKGVVTDWRFADLLPLVQAIQATNAEILHIQHAAGTYGFKRAIFLLPLLLKVTGWRGKIVTTVHEYGWWEWQPKRMPPQLIEWLKMWGQHRNWWDREDGFLLTLSDAVITTNTDAEAVIYKRLPELINRAYRIAIAANVEVAAIDRTTARQMLRLHCKCPEDSLAIAFFGFLHPVKGLEILLPAFKQVLAIQPQARLLLVGGVESLALRGEDAKQYWHKLNTLVAALNLSQLVHLTGYVNTETASHYLTGADIGVLPFNQGLTLKSGSLLALLAHGVPVIGTRHTTSLPDGHPIRLVPPRDIDALAAELLNLLNNPAKLTRMSVDSRAFVQNFRWQSIAKAHLDVYQTVLAH